MSRESDAKDGPRMRALIVTDNPLSASAIRRCLRSASFPEIVERYVDTSRPCGRTVAELAPDVLIVDETRTPEVALARIAEARAARRDLKVVLLTSRMDSAWLGRATAAGVDAAIRQTPTALSLGALVREVAAGNVFHAFAEPRAQAAPAWRSGLTTRELEILRLVAAGAPNSAIARQLWITEQTVKFHLSNVYRKLGVSNRTEASHYAHVNGLLNEDAVQIPLGSVPVAA
jgi:DNA-binding NarL/FixJ family response regulator